MDAAPPNSTQPPPAVVDAMTAGNPLLAIERWREATGMSLLDATAMVQELELGLGTHEGSSPRGHVDPGE